MSGEDTFEDAPQGGIKDLVEEAKRVRSHDKAHFQMRYNVFQNLVNIVVKDKDYRSFTRNLLEETYDNMVQAYMRLWRLMRIMRT